jgi:hypothetical protein
MNLTIISDDNAVYVDGVSLSNLAISVPANVHALQWKGTAGFIEFKDNADGTKPANQAITALPDFANACVTVYNNQVAANKVAADKAAADAAAAKAAAAAKTA